MKIWAFENGQFWKSTVFTTIWRLKSPCWQLRRENIFLTHYYQYHYFDLKEKNVVVWTSFILYWCLKKILEGVFERNEKSFFEVLFQIKFNVKWRSTNIISITIFSILFKKTNFCTHKYQKFEVFMNNCTGDCMIFLDLHFTLNLIWNNTSKNFFHSFQKLLPFLPIFLLRHQ